MMPPSYTAPGPTCSVEGDDSYGKWEASKHCLSLSQQCCIHSWKSLSLLVKMILFLKIMWIMEIFIETVAFASYYLKACTVLRAARPFSYYNELPGKEKVSSFSRISSPCLTQNYCWDHFYICFQLTSSQPLQVVFLFWICPYTCRD